MYYYSTEVESTLFFNHRTIPGNLKKRLHSRARKPRSSFQFFYDLIHGRLQLSMSACSSILSRGPRQVDTRNVWTSQQADHMDHQARRWSVSNTGHIISLASSTRDGFFCQLGEVQLLPKEVIRPSSTVWWWRWHVGEEINVWKFSCLTTWPTCGTACGTMRLQL